MSNLFENFSKYAARGIVPTRRFGYHLVPQNSFYKSVHYIDSVVGPVKNVALGSYKKNPSMIGIITFALASVILQPLYLALAYLSYWPAKGLAKVTDNYDLKCNTRSLIDYSSMLSCKAWDHSSALSKFVNAVLNYAVSAVIWAAALIVTPLIWAIDKVASKFSDAKSEGVGSPSFSK
ncbi:hypothetical protein HGO53_05470 [Wolbachia endosymbiont of Diaphorina citri]|jgi:hypothetical protein|uniref:hypothetical protein n=1 Tax=Wolbachia endosymbiont of Diaphorina citri TaxID=116598 RepID=UPI000304F5FE|nr:hypothetical protein [Wolbachia endosymbiont of Diaphorina citri]QJT94683.1 hypothetical protein HGO48_04760 [Wolbachia endosymbiont of Diaphorina citri]QJT95922.1 hypothetical protein HGO49_04760 [Wolbachia endosymbiont of Diaphorina citri]QJT97284.1 hypothetical protein HGO53_05470 [Wolbachia endosymbiont of Diaphorina citri]QLK11579.1 hypothetical protein FK497_04820 [Wolbachia endosymbiont of Diaphorina citri]QXY86887.1 hypothetical protein GZ064_02785 [Wolbachia endosymbiont of Diaphor